MRKTVKIIWTIVVLLLIAVIATGVYMYFMLGSALDNALELSALADSHGGRKNVLIVGTDASGMRSDVMMIASFPDGDGSINLMSVPRDTCAVIGGSTVKINSAMNNGDDAVVQAVQDLTGIEIHDYVRTNFEAVAGIVDELDGVMFYVPQDMDYEDPVQDLYIHLTRGHQLLTGQEAVQLLRFRGYGAADIQRTRVQRRFLKAAFAQKTKLGYALQVPDIMNVLGENMETTVTSGSAVSYLLKAAMADGMQTIEMPFSWSAPVSGGVSMDTSRMPAVVETYFK